MRWAALPKPSNMRVSISGSQPTTSHRFLRRRGLGGPLRSASRAWSRGCRAKSSYSACSSLSGGGIAVEYSSLPTTEVRIEKGPEYWAGWVYAYAQWETAWDFGTIFRTIPAREALVLYSTLHEAPEDRFVTVLRKRRQQQAAATRLSAIRKARGLTQQALAEQAGVSVRSVQMWEQRNKDINKAQASSVLALARVLGCEADALLETV